MWRDKMADFVTGIPDISALFDIDEWGNFMPVSTVTANHFELNAAGDIIPPEIPVLYEDPYYEIDSNGNIMPKA